MIKENKFKVWENIKFSYGYVFKNIVPFFRQHKILFSLFVFYMLALCSWYTYLHMKIKPEFVAETKRIEEYTERKIDYKIDKSFDLDTFVAWLAVESVEVTKELEQWKIENEALKAKYEGKNPDSIFNKIDVVEEVKIFQTLPKNQKTDISFEEYEYNKYKSQYTSFDNEMHELNEKLLKAVGVGYEPGIYIKNVLISNLICLVFYVILITLTIISGAYIIKKYFSTKQIYKKTLLAFTSIYLGYIAFSLIPSIIFIGLMLGMLVSENLAFFLTLPESFWFSNFLILNIFYIFILNLFVLPTLVLKAISKIKEDKNIRLKNIFYEVSKNCCKLLVSFFAIFTLASLLGVLKVFFVDIPIIFALLDFLYIVINYTISLIAIIFLCRFYEKIIVSQD